MILELHEQEFRLVQLVHLEERAGQIDGGGRPGLPRFGIVRSHGFGPAEQFRGFAQPSLGQLQRAQQAGRVRGRQQIAGLALVL